MGRWSGIVSRSLENQQGRGPPREARMTVLVLVWALVSLGWTRQPTRRFGLSHAKTLALLQIGIDGQIGVAYQVPVNTNPAKVAKLPPSAQARDVSKLSERYPQPYDYPSFKVGSRSQRINLHLWLLV